MGFLLHSMTQKINIKTIWHHLKPLLTPVIFLRTSNILITAKNLGNEDMTLIKRTQSTAKKTIIHYVNV